MRKSKFSESQIAAVLKEAEAGGGGIGVGTQARHQLGDILSAAIEVRRHERVGHAAIA